MSFQRRSIHQDAFGVLVKRVMDWSFNQKYHLSSLEIDRLDRVKKPRLWSGAEIHDATNVFDSLVQVSVTLQSKMSKSSHRRSLKAPDVSKADLEKSLRNHWAAILVEILSFGIGYAW